MIHLVVRIGSLPLGVQCNGTTCCQILHRSLIRIGCTSAVLLRIPTVECVTCPGVGIDGQIFRHAISHIQVVHSRTCAAVSIELYGIAVSFPVGGIGLVTCAACGNGNSGFSRRTVAARPAGEDIAASGRIVQRDCSTFDGVRRRIGRFCLAAAQIIGNRILYRCPVSSIVLVACASLGNGHIGLCSRTVTAYPAGEGITGFGRFVQRKVGSFNRIGCVGNTTAALQIEGHIIYNRCVSKGDDFVACAIPLHALRGRCGITGLRRSCDGIGCTIIMRYCVSSQILTIGRLINYSIAVAVCSPVRRVGLVTRAAFFNGHSGLGSFAIAARPAGEGVAHLAGSLQVESLGFCSVASYCITAQCASLQIIGDGVAPYRVGGIRHSRCRHREGIHLLCRGLITSPLAPGIAIGYGCFDCDGCTESVRSSAAYRFDTGSLAQSNGIAVTGVVIVHNCAAIGCNRNFFAFRCGKACVRLSGGSNLCSGSTGQFFFILQGEVGAILGIGSINILLPVLYPIGRVGSGCPAGGIFLVAHAARGNGHRGLSRRTVATCPACEGIAYLARIVQRDHRLDIVGGRVGCCHSAASQIIGNGILCRRPVGSIFLVSRVSLFNGHGSLGCFAITACPACEGITHLRRVVQRDLIRLNIVGGRIRGFHSAASQIVADLISNRCPLGIHRYRSASAQLHDSCFICVGTAGAVFRCIPAGESITRFCEGIEPQLLRHTVGSYLFLHLALAAVGIVFYDVLIGSPLGIKGHSAGGCQIKDGSAIRKGIAVSIGIGVPAGEGIVGSGEGVGAQRVRSVVNKGLIIHLTLAAVGIEFHSVCIGRPPGVQGYGSVINGCQILNRFFCGIGRAASIGGSVPAGEGIAKLAELVGIQLLCLIIGKVLVIHLAAAAVGIECHGVCIGYPLGIQGDDTAGCQILNALHIFIGCAASVGDCVPTGKGIAGSCEFIRRQLALCIVSKGLIIHPAFTVVGIKYYSICIGFPLGIQGYGSTIRGCQILNLFFCGIGIAVSIGISVPAGEGITRLAVCVGI